jgi:IS30 family transposase
MQKMKMKFCRKKIDPIGIMTTLIMNLQKSLRSKANKFMSIRKVLTFEERKAIEEKISQGIPTRQIAKEIGRATYTVRNEISKFGGRQFYSALAGQKRSDGAQESRVRKLKEYHAERNKYKIELTPYAKKKMNQSILSRLSILEQQVELLTKKLRGKNGENKKLSDVPETSSE